ncbi:extracellular solute-binding protein [Propioniciclava soli]|uniref:Extracellular solute-binding protein n=1 Tax=Propioniciclava soli TaxID=2775081 RepID=A0ABZ3C4A5_9ACTN
MTTMTRRNLLRLGALAGAGAVTAGCATPGTTSVNAEPTVPAAPAGETITLTYWAWLKDLQKVCDVWNAQNPHIQVQASWIQGGNAGGYQKLYSALAAGGGPDLGQVELRSLPEFMLVNGLVDLRRYGVDDYADRYNEALWQQVSYVDGVYGIPQDSGPMALYYRPDLLDAVGAAPPQTWAQWADVARAVRDTGAHLDCFNYADASWFAAMAQQAGARWLRVEDDSWVIALADETTLEVARFFDAAIDEGLLTTAYGQFSTPWFAAAANNDIAGLISASWGDALLQGVSGASGLWRVAPMPRWETGYASSFLGGSSAAVMANSRHPKEAMEFAVWMTTSPEGINAMIEHCGIGWSPASDYIGSAREGGSEFFGGQPYNTEVFEPAAAPAAQNLEWSWWPITQQSFNILADGFRAKAAGGTLVDAVVAAQGTIVRTFRNKGLTIREETA